jgi:hypothetical protein
MTTLSPRSATVGDGQAWTALAGAAPNSGARAASTSAGAVGRTSPGHPRCH